MAGAVRRPVGTPPREKAYSTGAWDLRDVSEHARGKAESQRQGKSQLQQAAPAAAKQPLRRAVSGSATMTTRRSVGNVYLGRCDDRPMNWLSHGSQPPPQPLDS